MRISQSIPTKVTIILCWLICSSMIASAADPITPAEWGTIINLSGRQRMLSQKMSKEILLISLNYNPTMQLRKINTTYCAS
ncbi:hypothetical protein [uncultured Desulfobacter sp.]|uniref:hypothetical protein n=1 Tax=uncultured Desulfobacter sp. TaxID=240139 RepID=UPI002D1E412E|nr:hypothetical protein [uncultured Desulfobacter sp.]